MTLSPYARIAAELRDQIETGALAPGDRVPSTREITQRWGVAMATATKALAALGREGIVRSVPGVGTVVVGRQPTRGRPPALPPAAIPPGPTAAGRRGAADPRLAPGRIVASAMAVADAEGLQRWGEASRAMGFEGMGCVHPLQIPILHRAFAPSALEIEKARKIAEAFGEAQARGLGVVSVGSKMIDPPVVHRALKLVERARQMGLVSAEPKTGAEQ